MALELSRAGSLPFLMRSPLVQLSLRLLLSLVLVLQAAGASAHDIGRLLDPPCPMQANDAGMADCDCCGDDCAPVDCMSLLPMAAVTMSTDVAAIGWLADYRVADVGTPLTRVRGPPLRPPIL